MGRIEVPEELLIRPAPEKVSITIQREPTTHAVIYTAAVMEVLTGDDLNRLLESGDGS